MFVAMKPHAAQAEFQAVRREDPRRSGSRPTPITGTERKVVAVIGHTTGLDPEDLFGTMPGVAEALRVSQPFKLVSREVKEEDTVIDVGGVPLGGKAIAVMAGPVLGRVAGADPRGGARGEGGGRDLPARRRLQAAHEPVRVPGAARGGPEAARARARGDRPQGRDRGEGHRDPADGRRVRRRAAGRRAQHAELLAAREARRDRQAHPPEARPLRHDPASGSWPPSTSSRRGTSGSRSASAASARSRR